MDRLYAVILPIAVAGATACDSRQTETPEADTPAANGRVNAVQATKKEAEPLSDFCDVYNEPGKGPTMTLPALDGAPPPAPAEGSWRWVNLWATWCAPCIEEMPRLQKWESELKTHGLGDVTFISADNTAEVLDKFAQKHPDLPGVEGPRIAEASALMPWLEELGLSGAALPVHIFVEPGGTVRCLRAGGVGDGDRVTVEKLLTADG